MSTNHQINYTLTLCIFVKDATVSLLQCTHLIEELNSQMVITAIDGRNMQLVIDIRHMKCLVELMRTVKNEALVAASEVLQQDGFTETTAFDVMAAVTAFCSIAGYITDQVVKAEDGKPATVTPPGQEEPQGEEQSKAEERKVYLN